MNALHFGAISIPPSRKEAAKSELRITIEPPYAIFAQLINEAKVSYGFF